MSTEYRPLRDILFAHVFDGRLEKYGVKEETAPNPKENTRYLVGCDGFLQVHRQADGTCDFTRRGWIPWSIFDAIAEEFGAELVCEHDHRYWGFNTEEEWDNWRKQRAKEAEDDFYNNLVKYVRGEPNRLTPGTVGMLEAEIAKTLVENDPNLLAPGKRDTLFEAVTAAYDRDHAVMITLTKRDLAMTDLMAARTSDLPKA